VLEYCKLGSLSTWLNECAREQRAVPLFNAVKIGKDLAAALEFLHEPSRDSGRYVRIPVAHRDVKSTNILLRSDSHALLSDFGLAKMLDSGNQMMSTVCGTPSYLAPEIINGQKYGTQCDVWSLGVILYTLLCGYPPFSDENNATMMTSIKQGAFEFPSPDWDINATIDCSNHDQSNGGLRLGSAQGEMTVTFESGAHCTLSYTHDGSVTATATSDCAETVVYASTDENTGKSINFEVRSLPLITGDQNDLGVVV